MKKLITIALSILIGFSSILIANAESQTRLNELISDEALRAEVLKHARERTGLDYGHNSVIDDDILLSFTYLKGTDKGIKTLDGIENLTNLKYADLLRNEINELPEDFGKLTELNRINLFGNNLTKLPNSFGELQKLQELTLSYNKLESLPESFGNLHNLRDLRLYASFLTELPDSIIQLEKLTRLNLDFNSLEYLSHDQIDWLKGIDNLSMQNQRIYGNQRIPVLVGENNIFDQFQILTLLKDHINKEEFNAALVKKHVVDHINTWEYDEIAEDNIDFNEGGIVLNADFKEVAVENSIMFSISSENKLLANSFALFDIEFHNNIILEYVDQSGNKIKEDEVVQGKIGTEFINEPDHIPGYEFINQAGTHVFDWEVGTLTYVFEEVPQEGVIEVNYVDEEYNTLLETAYYSAELGTNYHINAIDIENYELVQTKGETKGTYSDEVQVITFVYKEIEPKADDIIQNEENKNQDNKVDFNNDKTLNKKAEDKDITDTTKESLDKKETLNTLPNTGKSQFSLVFSSFSLILLGMIFINIKEKSR